MAISEEKMRMVIKNYFKTECDINTTINEAFEKGFRIGVQKGISAQPEITDEQAIEHLQSTGWMQEHDRILSSAQPEYFDYTDIDEAWEYYAKEQDANLTDNAKQIKDAMWVGYRIGSKSAQPERKKAEWVWSDEDVSWKCSSCDCVFEEFDWKPEYNFCPNCGCEIER